jgi:hypothetical protein
MNKTDDLEEIWQSRADRIATSATLHPFGFAAKVIGGFLALALILGVFGFAMGWFRTGVKVISPANVTAQYRLAFQDYNGLQATASNACVMRDSLATLSGDAFNQRQSELLAVIANYNRVKAEYEARMQNIFEANKVKPAQLPFEAPSESDMELQVC